MSFKGFRQLCPGVAIGLGLLAAGGLAERLERDWRPVSATMERRTGVSGVSWMMLGGFRALVADFYWVRAYGEWARRDLAGMRRALAWVGAIDPQPLTFWLNGARMLGFDATAWRVARGDDPQTASREQLGEALAYLARARTHHPERSAVEIEEAMLRLRLGQDVAGAVLALERADACADAPDFVGRLRAELLGRLGRDEEALTVLRNHRAGLDETHPDAMVAVVDQRLAELEARLSRTDAAGFTPEN